MMHLQQLYMLIRFMSLLCCILMWEYLIYLYLYFFYIILVDSNFPTILRKGDCFKRNLLKFRNVYT